MLILFIFLGMAAIASGLVLFRYVANLLRHLPGSNDDFTWEMTDERSGAGFSCIYQGSSSPSDAACNHAGTARPSAQAAYLGEII